MKNILTAVVMLCLLGMGTTIWGQGHLSVIKEEMPCSLTNSYTLYLQAKAPPVDPVNPSPGDGCYADHIQIVGANPFNVTTCPIPLGTLPGTRVPLASSPTGWAYCINVPGTNQNRVIRVRELYYNYDCSGSGKIRRINIVPRATKRPVPIIDLELVETDLCNGKFTVQAHNASSTHDSYEWSYNNNPYQTTMNATNSFNFPGQIANTTFTVGVKVSNKCGDESYSEVFKVKDPIFAAQPKIQLPAQYCDGTKNEFTINQATPSVEYKWEFIPNAPAMVIEQGLDMTSFSPNFGTTNVTGVGATTSYTINLYIKFNCSSGWILGDQKVITSVTYSSNCNGSGGGSSKIANQSMNLESLVNRHVNEGNGSSLSALDGQGSFSTAYPNPTTGKVEVKNSSEAIQNIFVYDATGTLVVQKLEVKNNTATIDLSDLSNGMYFITVQGKTTSENLKVIKQ